jgi:hypothetical protein
MLKKPVSNQRLVLRSSALCKILGPLTDSHFAYKDSAIAHTLSYSIAGSGAKLFRLPRNLTDSLDITLRYLIIQVFYRSTNPVNITLYLRMTTQEIFKFCFTTQERKNRHLSKTSTQILLGSVPRGVWVNLCYDLEFVATEYWTGSAFESLQQLEISSSCLVRWIYASRVPLRPELSGSDLPRSMRLAGGIESQTVLIAGQSKRRPGHEDDDSEPDAFRGALPSESEGKPHAVHAEENITDRGVGS